MQFSKLTVMGSDQHFEITVATMWRGNRVELGSQLEHCCNYSGEGGWREMSGLERDLGGRFKCTWDMEG